MGNHLEANEELEKITASLRAHPDVLMVRWQIYAKGQQWEGAFEIARALAEMVPEFPTGWIYQAEALRRMPGEGVKKAWAALLPAADMFPKEPAILYNLACYSCQMDAPRDPLTDESLARGFGTLTEVLQKLRTCSGMFAALSPNSDNRSRRLRRFERSISRRTIPPLLP